MDKIDVEVKGETFPAIAFELKQGETIALYSNAELQAELLTFLEDRNEYALAGEWDALYDRLPVIDNVKFYRKWFGGKWTIEELLVRFELQHCARKRVNQCTGSEKRRLAFLKSWLAKGKWNIFAEPVHGMDIVTINVFMKLLGWIAEDDASSLVLVSNMEHAIMLGDRVHHLKENGLHEVEMSEDAGEPERTEGASEAAATTEASRPIVAGLYKIPAKTGEKVILFDPTEIDYIESQDGKVQLVLNEGQFMMDMTLTEAETKLAMYGFYRCHRSYIVNLQKVREIITWSKNTYSLRLQNGPQSTIPLSRTKLQEVQEIFSLK